jgi:hypothetical protein
MFFSFIYLHGTSQLFILQTPDTPQLRSVTALSWLNILLIGRVISFYAKTAIFFTETIIVPILNNFWHDRHHHSIQPNFPIYIQTNRTCIAALGFVARWRAGAMAPGR